MTLAPAKRAVTISVLALAALIATVAGGLPGSGEAFAATREPGEVVNVAHRGASAYAPENTIAAVEKAIQQDADMVEVDVQLSENHRLVVMHDVTLDRTTNVESVFPDQAPWDVGDFTLAEISKLDAGSWFDPRFAGEEVPTLIEVMDTLKGTGVGLFLEVKSPSLYPRIDERVAKILRAHPYWLRPGPEANRLVVQSFDWEFMRDFHELLPRVTAGLLGRAEPEQLAELAAFSDQINPNFTTIDAGYVARVHEAGMDVNVYTVNEREAMRRVIKNDVDGIITNRPDVLADLLGPGASAPAA